MNTEPKEITRNNCTHTKLIRFWSKEEMAESAHARVQHYKILQDVDQTRLLMSELIIKTT